MKIQTLRFIVLIVFIVSVSKLTIDFLQKKNDNQNFQKLETKVEKLDNPYLKLKSENEDYIAWIKINHTNINYPVMQTKSDEQYYLNRNFQNQYSPSGTPFMSISSDLETSRQLIIYGHNMGNDFMFSNLVLYKDKDFYNNHRVIELTTKEGTREYSVFSVFKINLKEENHFDFYNFNNLNKEQIDEFNILIKNNNLYNNNVKIDENDKILTLVTCDDTGDSNRVVVMAKL